MDGRAARSQARSPRPAPLRESHPLSRGVRPTSEAAGADHPAARRASPDEGQRSDGPCHALAGRGAVPTLLDALPRKRRRRPKRHRYRTDWASLLRRVFLVDFLTCSQCQGRLRIVAKVDNPDAVHAMLRHLGLLDDPQPDRQGQYRKDEPQLELAYDFGA